MRADGVFEGGGVKGVGLLGAVERAEAHGVEWERVGGTSAGDDGAGILFIALGVVFLVDDAGGIDIDVRWVWPALLIGLGIAGLVRSRPRR